MKTLNDGSDEETPCPKREDKQHCNCWYDGKPCCACGDNGELGMVEAQSSRYRTQLSRRCSSDIPHPAHTFGGRPMEYCGGVE
jgi:hypothetical protein